MSSMKSLQQIITIGVIIIIVLFIAYSYREKREPFVNPVVVSNITSNPDEIFLVATNPGTFKINSPSDSFSYSSTGYTYTEAQSACASFGGRLADLTTVTTGSSQSPSKLSLELVRDLSANWCAAGWTAGNSEYAYFPMSDFTSLNKCKLSNQSNSTTNINPETGKYYLPVVKGLGKYKPSDGKAFAICVGKKPPYITTRVNPFNSNSYSMYNENMMTYLKTGKDINNPYNDDMFPIEFTDGQVYNALQSTSPIYNVLSARTLLKDRYKEAATTTDNNPLTNDPLNNNIYDSEANNIYTPETVGERSEWENDSLNKSCSVLSSIYTRIDTNLTALKAIFSDVSGNLQNIIGAKQDNSNMQSVINLICKNASEQSIESKACARILSIDFDILYRNKSSDPTEQKNVIKQLEALNLALRMRECEIQQSLGSLQYILDAYKNNSTCSSTLDTLKTKYKNNLVSIKDVKDPTRTIQVPINCDMYFDSSGNVTNNASSQYSSPRTAFKIGRDIEYNNVDLLKLRIQEISPYFTTDQYKSIVSEVLNELSATLRSPPPSEFLSINSIVKSSTKIMNSIVSLFPNLV
jgi:hypothetical protein